MVQNTFTFGGEKIHSLGEKGKRDYLGGFEFLDGKLESFQFGDGRVVFEEGSPTESRFQYIIKDHLGNTAVLFEDKNQDGKVVPNVVPNNPENEVLQRNYYYPATEDWGRGPRLASEVNSTFWPNAPAPVAQPTHDYLYNGKELDESYGLDWHWYGARMYDAGVGRFTGVDPIAGQFPSLSSYNFAANGPISNIDLFGLQPYSMVEGEANRIANDVNAIYYAKYCNAEAASAVAVIERQVTVPNPEYGFISSFWTGEPKTISETRFYLAADPQFDWTTDKYTQAHKGVLESDVPVSIRLMPDSRRKPPVELQRTTIWEDGQQYSVEVESPVPNDMQWDMIYNIGGGDTGHFPEVRLSSKLLDTPIGAQPSTQDYTIGGMYLHELLYHLSYIGILDKDQPQKMRDYYNIATNNSDLSTKHGPGGRTNSMGVDKPSNDE